MASRLERELNGLEMLKNREHTAGEEDALTASAARVTLLLSLSKEQLAYLQGRVAHEVSSFALGAQVDAQYAREFREENNEARARDYDKEEAQAKSRSEAFRVLAEILKIDA